MYVVEEFIEHPSFYCIVERNTDGYSTWNLYLHKNKSIQTYVGFMVQSPNEMSGLWDTKEAAEHFLADFNAARS